jgi:hypothetical protein
VLPRSPLFSLVAHLVGIGIRRRRLRFTVFCAVVPGRLPIPNPQQQVSAQKVSTTQRHPQFLCPQVEPYPRALDTTFPADDDIPHNVVEALVAGGAR